MSFTLNLTGTETTQIKFNPNHVLPNSFFDENKSLSDVYLDMIYNKDLLNNLIKNPKDDEGNYCVNLSKNEIIDLKKLKKALKTKGSYTYCNNQQIGRVYHNSNIQFINSTLRKTILYDNYFELDITNAQPTILQQLCKFHQIKTPKLNSFVTDREKILNDYIINYEITRAEAKEKITSIFFIDICFDNNLKELHKEVKEVTFKLKELYPKIDKYKSMKHQDKDSSFLALLLQTIENRIITLSYHFLKTKQIDSGLILHDALYIRNKLSYEHLSFINLELSKYIQTNFYGFQIVFKLSDFKTETLSGHEVLKVTPKALTDKEIVDAYYEYTKKEGSKVIYVNKTCWVCDENCIWQEGNDAFIRTIFIDTEFNEYLLINKSNKINYQTSREWDNLFGYLRKDQRFYKPVSFQFNDKPDILAFNNKMCVVMNKFNKQEPFTIRELQPDDNTTMTTGFPLQKELLLDSYKDFCKTLITNQFQDQDTAETYMTIIGLSLYGELLVKKFFINKGYGDNGRSFFANVISSVFGDYHGSFNSDFFISKDFSDGDIKSPEAIENKDKRFITINEPTSSNGFKSTTWATEKIKTFTGNDILSVRKLQENKIYKYINKASILNSVNTLPLFTNVDSALKVRVSIIPQDTQFVDICTLEHHRLKIKDTTFLQDNKFKNCMMFVLLDYWSKFVKDDLILNISKQIEEYTSEIMSDKLDDFINTYYIKTTSKKNFVTLDDMYNLYLDIVPQGNFNISSRTFKEKLSSKRLIIKKIDRTIDGERINRDAIINIKLIKPIENFGNKDYIELNK